MLQYAAKRKRRSRRGERPKLELRATAPLVFGIRLDQLCSEAGTKQIDLPDQLPFHRTTLYKWRRATELPDTLLKLVALADHFGVSVDWLLGRSEAREAGKAPPPSQDRQDLKLALEALRSLYDGGEAARDDAAKLLDQFGLLGAPAGVDAAPAGAGRAGG